MTDFRFAGNATRHAGRLGLILALLALGACASLPPPAPEPVFTLQKAFGGRTEGEGSLKLLFQPARPFRVESHGREQDDGTFRLDQAITFEGEKPQSRTWILESCGSGCYTGSLSDAAGTVHARVDGARLRLRYRIRGLLFMAQTLDLSSDGRTIDNRGRISLLGIPIGEVREVITVGQRQ